MQENYKIFKDLIQTVLLNVLEILNKKKALKMKKSSENDQSAGHFQRVFFAFFRPRP